VGSSVQPGTTVAGRFLVEGTAGTGGMGTVFRARDQQTGQPVALKILDLLDTRGAHRFAREAALLAELVHPGIVRYVCHGTTLGAGYLAMEWVEGESLAHRLATSGLTCAESVHLGAAVASALGAAHRLGVVHRDIKPSNILLPDGSAERPKLIDFGIARRLLQSVELTHTGALIGSPGYLAPEQARGDRDVDARADLFALGSVLYECLTGRAAFAGQNVMAVLTKILLAEPPPLPSNCPEAPPVLVELISRMLAKDPELRPRDGAQVAAELGNLSPPADAVRRPTATASAATATLAPADLLARHGAATVALPAEQLVALVLASGDAGRAAERHGALCEAADRHGARLSQLSDGTVLLVLWLPRASGQNAARAGHAALTVRALLPAAAVALAVEAVAGPLDDVIDRSATLLAAPGEAPPGVRLLGLAGQLLGEEFDLARSPDGEWLCGAATTRP
jgi:hypothetical protein